MVKKGVKRTLNQARSRQDKAQNVMLKQLASDVAQLKSSVETKYSYTANQGIAIQGWDPTSRDQNIFPVRIGSVQGTKDVDQRIGDVVNVKSINLAYTLQLQNGAAIAADAYNRVRVILFWDTDPVFTSTAGAYSLDTPEWNQIFQTPTLQSSAGTPLVILSPKDHDRGRRFQILHSKVHSLAPNLNGNLSSIPTNMLGLGPRSITGVEYVNKSYKIGRKIRYSGGGLTPINRALYLAVISDSTYQAHPSMDYTLKVSYEDA